MSEEKTDIELLLLAQKRCQETLVRTVNAMENSPPPGFPANPIAATLMLGSSAHAIDRDKGLTLDTTERNSYYGDLVFLAAIQDAHLEQAIGTMMQAITRCNVRDN